MSRRGCDVERWQQQLQLQQAGGVRRMTNRQSTLAFFGQHLGKLAG